MSGLLFTVITAVVCENFVLDQLLGLDSAIECGRSFAEKLVKRFLTAVFMVLASVAAFAVSEMLSGYDLEYLNVLIFSILLAGFELIGDFLGSRFRKYSAEGTAKTGIFLNTAVFGVIYLASDCRTLQESLMFGIVSGAGLFFASLLIMGLAGRLETADIPEAFRGIPILVIAAGLCALIFTGFSGLSI